MKKKKDVREKEIKLHENGDGDYGEGKKQVGKRKKENERWIGEDRLEEVERKLKNKYWKRKRIKRKKTI